MGFGLAFQFHYASKSIKADAAEKDSRTAFDRIWDDIILSFSFR